MHAGPRNRTIPARANLSIRSAGLRLPAGTGAAQNQFTKTVDKVGRQPVMPYEEPHVDGSVEGIQNEIHVDIFAQFAAQNPALERGVSLPAARPEEALAESRNELSVTLSGAKNRGNNAPAAAPEDLYHLTHLLSHVGANRTSIREVELPGRAAGERICNEGSLVRPPAVNSRFADGG